MFASLFSSTLRVLALASMSATAAAQSLPTAAVRNVEDTHFGVKVADPYRYFENAKDKEVAAWMRTHSDHANKTLGRIAGRGAVLAGIQKYEDAVSARVFGVVRTTGSRIFYERRSAGENQFKLLMREGWSGTERVLVDPEQLEKKTGKPHAINYFSVSPDGLHVAYGLSVQGSEDAVLHVLDVATQKPVGKSIDRVQFGGVDWSPDGKRIFFNRLQPITKGMPGIQKFQRSRVFGLTLGMPISSAKAVFGMGVPGVNMLPAEIPFSAMSYDGKWALGFVVNGTQREQAAYIASQSDVLSGKAKWRRLVDFSDEVTGMAYFDNQLYLKTHKGSSRSKITVLDLSTALLQTPDVKLAKEVVPTSDRVVTNMAAAADALYIEAREGNVKRLYKRAHGDNQVTTEVKLPIEGAFELSGDEGGSSAADPRLPGLLIELQSWTRARQIYSVNADASVANTGLQPQGPFDAPQDLVASEIKVKSHDGAMVPMSIIHKKSVVLDGTNPTLLYGYASYGITEEPFFSTGRLAWLDQGGVFAVTNPRGSSVYGQDWYKAGFQATKPNTWKDFIACAEYLIAQKYTSPAKLGIMGGSAGGILVGRAMTERPDLFAAVIPAVGALDGIRFESTPNGVPNIPEFGSIKTEAGFKSLLAMSTYANILDGTRYPAILLTHGVNDPRVEVWQSTKTAARLMAATSSAKPVLIRLDYDAGHGIGNTKKQQQAERADMYSFLLWQMGVPGFELK